MNERQTLPTDPRYVPGCLRNLPKVRRIRLRLNQSELSEQAAVIKALEDVLDGIRTKIQENPEWTMGYYSARTIVEARIKQERERKP